MDVYATFSFLVAMSKDIYMSYYDKIAKQWHQHTGFKGGPFKALILNERLLAHIGPIADQAILEIGAGNGYFIPWLLRRKSGQIPRKLYITDVSFQQLAIAKKYFFLPNAQYESLDLYRPFKYDDQQFELIIANMVFNELTKNGIQQIGRAHV